MLEGGALSSAAFREFSKTVVPFVHITTRIDDRPLEDLLLEKDGNSFPYVCVLDAAGEVVAKHNGANTVKAFATTIAKVRRLGELAKKKDAPSKIDAAILRCDLGQIAYEDVEEQLEELGEVSAAQKAALKTQEANGALAELQLVMMRARGPKVRASIVEELVSLYEDGMRPSHFAVAEWYWRFLASHASRKGNTALLEEALKKLKPIYADVKGGSRILERLEAKLAKLKDASK